MNYAKHALECLAAGFLFCAAGYFGYRFGMKLYGFFF